MKIEEKDFNKPGAEQVEDILAEAEKEEIKARPEAVREEEGLKEVGRERAVQKEAGPEAERRMVRKRAPVSAPALPKVAKSERQKEVEAVLAEDLVSLYQKLDPAHQEQFKLEGEKVAFKIETLLQRAKVRANEILKLIKNWLKLIPGVNKFFLEQEAKIKTDKIMALKKKK